MYPNEVLKKLARAKGAGKPDQMYDLAVPTGDAQAVANALALANVDFDVNQSYSNGVTTYFVMPNEAEHHAAEAILRDKFQKQITTNSPGWDEWSEGAEMPDPSEVTNHPQMTKMNAGKVQIRDGSGVDSNKTGEIISWDSPEAKEVRNNYPFVGGRTPQSMNWVAIKLDSGEITTQPKNNVQRVKGPGMGSPEFKDYYLNHPKRHSGAAAGTAPAYEGVVIPLENSYICSDCQSIGNSAKYCPHCNSTAVESVSKMLGGRVPEMTAGPNAKPKEAGIPDFDKEMLIEHLSGLAPDAIVEDVQNHFGPGAVKDWALAVARELQGPSQEPVEAADKDGSFFKESDPDREDSEGGHGATGYGSGYKKDDGRDPRYDDNTPHMASSLFKRAVGDVLNQTCPNCERPIKQGEMVNWTSSGAEAHTKCPLPAGGSGNLMMPKNYQNKNQDQNNQMPHTVPPELPGYGQHAAGEKTAKHFSVYDNKFKRTQEGDYSTLRSAIAGAKALEAQKGTPGEERFVVCQSRPGVNQMIFQYFNQKGEPITVNTLTPQEGERATPPMSARARVALAKGRKVRLASGERVERSIEKIAFNVKTAKVQISQGEDAQGFHMLVNLNGTEYVLRGGDAEQFRKDYAAIPKPEEKVNALVERYLGKLQRYAPAAKKPPVKTQEDRAKELADADNYWQGKGAPEQQLDSEHYYEGKGAPATGQSYRRYMSSTLFKNAAEDDMCNACGTEVANRECDHGLLCDKCDEQVHGSVGGPCDLTAPTNLKAPKKETTEGYDRATQYAPGPEDFKRWARAINNTYQAIGSDANLEGEKPWVIVQVCLDANHCEHNGGLPKEEYAKFQAWYRDIFQKKGYESGLKYIAKFLKITG